MKCILFPGLLMAISITILFTACIKEQSCESCNTVSSPVNNSVNRPPFACAGLDQITALPFNTVQLNGSCSTDPDNDIAGYQWTNISGPATARIVTANRVQTEVNNLVEGTYLFQLKVTDAGGLFSMDTVQVLVIKQTNDSLVDIYVAGELNGQAVYWKNGQVVKIKSSPNSNATSIAKSGNDIYVAGSEGDALVARYNVAKYWKNGEPVDLTGPTGAGANSIEVVGSDVYVAGWELKGYAIIAQYWKNGQAVALTDGTKEAEATCIKVVDGNVFVAGHENGVAKYWKNGQAIALTNGSQQAYANSIAVDGNDVYVAGSESNGTAHVAKYWKNGQAVTLTNGRAVHATANDIAVTNGVVHVAGWEGDFLGRVGGTEAVAKYWKNGQEVKLSNGSGYAYPSSIAIYGSDVYVAGTESYMAQYWKIGQPVPVTLSYSAGATSILVVPK